MNKHFDYFFPPDSYLPLDYIKIDEQDIVIERVRHEPLTNTFYHNSSVIKQNVYNHVTPEDGTLCASITIPFGKILEIVKRCNDDETETISSICGPIKTLYTNQGLFESECYLRSRNIEPILTYNDIQEELVYCQKHLIIRLYSEPLFNNFKLSKGKYRDIPISTTLEYPNFLRYQSMIIPYGIYIDNVGELQVDDGQVPATFSLKPGRLYGPCILSDVSKLYVYHKQSYIHEAIHSDERVFEKQIDKENVNSVIQKIMTPKTVVMTNKKLQVTVRLSHYLYKHLKPLIGAYFMSQCLSQEYTGIIKKDCPWKMSDKEAEQIIMYWLVKTNGNYSYIADFFNNSQYNAMCRKILALYSKNTQY